MDRLDSPEERASDAVSPASTLGPASLGGCPLSGQPAPDAQNGGVKLTPVPTLDKEAWRDHPYAEFLAKLEKPGRYLGGEEQSRVKSWSDPAITCRFVLAFPDIYEIGMSHLGTRILYGLINDAEDLACERAFSPWRDAEAQLRDRNMPLVSLESYTPLHRFDVIGVSLQYELCYSNVLLNLELGGVSLRNEDRAEHEPIVLAGGPTATHPEPLADFVDVFLVGEAEEVLAPALRLIGQMRKDKAAREDILGALARMPGFYVPRFYDVAIDERSGLEYVSGPNARGEAQKVPFPINRVFVRDLDEFPFPTQFPIPYAQAIFDRASVEITRGCTEGCRFCQAGMIYRPVRERKPEDVIDAVLKSTDAAGFDEASLTALSTADVSCIDPLIKALVPELSKRKVSLGIASLRAYGLNDGLLDEIQKVGIDGLTFAPEAGTQRMRNVINKNVSDQDILDSARRIFERGYERMKMYFIMGLPTETEEDVVGIIETGREVRKVARECQPGREAKITVSVSQHVPKPHTPFQWAAMDSIQDLESKVALLRSKAKWAGVDLKTHTIQESWLECLFARGGRSMGRVLEIAYKNGARFDGWKECFSFSRWIDAIEEAGVEPSLLTGTIAVDAKLPWDHIDVGLDEGFLAGEYRKAVASRISPPCGKPAGAQVHHTTLHGEKGALAEKRRLVCYDCGIACDMSEMRDERIESLRSLEARSERAAALPVVSAPKIDVSLDRLRGVLSQSKLADHDVKKASAEAPFSRLRIFYSKVDTMAFMGHLDLVRMFPRMLRRAKLELAFTRGFHALPRMSFAPALALGVVAHEEAVDCDVILEDSLQDMLGRWDAQTRKTRAAQLLAALQECAPPGLVIRGGRLLEPGERKIGDLVAGADYELLLSDEEVDEVEAQVQKTLAQDEVIVMRTPKRKKKKGKRGRGSKPKAPAEPVPLNILPIVQSMFVDRDRQRLCFRVLSGQEGAKARPREIVQAFCGRPAKEHQMTRVRLLGRSAAGDLVSLADLGTMLKKDRAKLQNQAQL